METEGGGSPAEWLCQMRAIEIKMKHAYGRGLAALTFARLVRTRPLTQRRSNDFNGYQAAGWLVMMMVVIHLIK